MPRFLRALALLNVLVVVACAAPPTRPTATEAQKQVADTERAFAKTMADRDHAAFSMFLADETVFFSGPTPLHGKAEVAAF